MKGAISDKTQTAAIAMAACILLAGGALAILPPSRSAAPTSIVRIKLPEPQGAKSTELAPPLVPESENLPEDLSDRAKLDTPLDAARPSAGPSAQSNDPRVDHDGIIPIQFDLESLGKGTERVEANAILVQKELIYNSRELGIAQIRIDSSSRLFADASKLRELLQRSRIAQNKLVASDVSGYQTFEELRRLGLDLRYDASSDKINLTID